MTRALLALLKLYRYLLSPLLPPSCRYTPSCSEYTLEAIKAYGPWQGSLLGLRRISRCHPFTNGGYDPLPLDLEADRWFRSRIK